MKDQKMDEEWGNVTNEMRQSSEGEKKYSKLEMFILWAKEMKKWKGILKKINPGNQSCGKMYNEWINEQKEWMKECETEKKDPQMTGWLRPWKWP